MIFYTHSSAFGGIHPTVSWRKQVIGSPYLIAMTFLQKKYFQIPCAYNHGQLLCYMITYTLTPWTLRGFVDFFTNNFSAFSAQGMENSFTTSYDLDREYNNNRNGTMEITTVTMPQENALVYTSKVPSHGWLIENSTVFSPDGIVATLRNLNSSVTTTKYYKRISATTSEEKRSWNKQKSFACKISIIQFQNIFCI